MTCLMATISIWWCRAFTTMVIRFVPVRRMCCLCSLAATITTASRKARQTYNDVMKTALKWMKGEQALMATEIVYALTNDKGRTRAERAGEKYYRGIRETPYAPFVKLCDRLANISYSCSADGGKGSRMKGVYRAEMPHFLPSIDPHSDDIRFQVPTDVVEALAEILIDELERDEVRRQWLHL